MDITIEEAAAESGMHLEHLRRLARDGQIPGARKVVTGPGKRTRWLMVRDQWDAWRRSQPTLRARAELAVRVAALVTERSKAEDLRVVLGEMVAGGDADALMAAWLKKTAGAGTT